MVLTVAARHRLGPAIGDLNDPDHKFAVRALVVCKNAGGFSWVHAAALSSIPHSPSSKSSPPNPQPPEKWMSRVMSWGPLNGSLPNGIRRRKRTRIPARDDEAKTDDQPRTHR
jgi:hypothetical protein